MFWNGPGALRESLGGSGNGEVREVSGKCPGEVRQEDPGGVQEVQKRVQKGVQGESRRGSRRESRRESRRRSRRVSTKGSRRDPRRGPGGSPGRVREGSGRADSVENVMFLIVLAMCLQKKQNSNAFVMVLFRM